MASYEVQEMLDRMSDRMAEPMSNDPDWREEASQIEEMLDRSDSFVLPRHRRPGHACVSRPNGSRHSGPTDSGPGRFCAPSTLLSGTTSDGTCCL
jgi:hypothetical protein